MKAELAKLNIDPNAPIDEAMLKKMADKIGGTLAKDTTKYFEEEEKKKE